MYQRRKPQNVKKKSKFFLKYWQLCKNTFSSLQKNTNKNAKKWNKPKSPSLKQWMDAVNDIYSM